mgnify:CR=1 FL=1
MILCYIVAKLESLSSSQQNRYICGFIPCNPHRANDISNYQPKINNYKTFHCSLVLA